MKEDRVADKDRALERAELRAIDHVLDALLQVAIRIAVGDLKWATKEQPKCKENTGISTTALRKKRRRERITHVFTVNTSAS